MTYRNKYQEVDLSGFVQGGPGEIGAMVVSSLRGRSDKPIKCQGEDDVILHYGDPSATYPDVFEAISFCKTSPCWVVSAVGEEAVWGGVDVKQTSVTGFGAGAGRVDPSTFNYASVNTYQSLTPTGLVNGINAQFTGTFSNLPVEDGSLVITVAGERKEVDDASGLITGNDINLSGTNTITLATGAFDYTLAGIPGTIATVSSDIDLSANVDLSTQNTAGVQTITNTGTLLSFPSATVPGIATQVDYELDITIDGGANQLVDISISILDDWDDVAAAIETSLQTSTGSTETVAIVSGIITVTSATTGSTSSVVIAAGTAGTGSGDLLGVIDLLGVNYTTNIVAATAGTDVDFEVDITIDTVTNTVNFGHVAATTSIVIIGVINAAFTGTPAIADGNFVNISGILGDESFGHAKYAATTGTGYDGLDTIFSTAGTALEDYGTNPTGAIPRYSDTILTGSIYNVDLSTTVSHSFFNASASADYLAAKIEHVENYKFKLTLYRVVGNSNYDELNVYNYSLIREKDNFKRSLYWEDVFRDNPYIIMVINSAYAGGAYAITASTVDFSGGYRGEAVSDGDYQGQWDFFKIDKKYPANILMDPAGNSASQLNTICTTYQVTSHGITVAPIGNSITTAITHRGTIGLDSDKVSMYTNWSKIVDSYNDSTAWVSLVGSVGRKYALMIDAYDAPSPAGDDENLHGGVLQDYTVLEQEFSPTEAEFQLLDEAQLNPIVKGEDSIVKIKGDKTQKVALSDTSYVGTRRLYNYIRKVLNSQVLEKQEFKVNDSAHRLSAKLISENFLAPIEADGWIRDYYVQCDDKNNNDSVLDQREFILDIFIQITPNSQFTLLRLTRLSQTQSIASFT